MSNLFSLFQISLESYFKLKAGLLKYSQCQPSEIEKMDFYEIEIILDNLKELAEEEEKERKKKDKDEASAVPNISSYQRQMQSTLNSSRGTLPMPSMPNFKL